MVGRCNQRTKTIRFNLSKDDERVIFEELERHDRKVPDDPYGSSGAYIKAALREYMARRDEREMKNDFMQMLAGLIEVAVEQVREKLTEDLHRNLEEIDEVLRMMRDLIENGRVSGASRDDINPSNGVPSESDCIITSADEGTDNQMPSEIDDFLSGFGL